MKCIQHAEHDAVAVCTACGRALCPQCVVFPGDAAACNGRCENVVESQQRQRRGNDAAFQLLLEGKYQDESLTAARVRVQHARFWLVVVLIPLGILLFKAVNSNQDSRVMYLWLAGLPVLGLIASIQSIIKWRKVIAKREAYIAHWTAE